MPEVLLWVVGLTFGVPAALWLVLICGAIAFPGDRSPRVFPSGKGGAA